MGREKGLCRFKSFLFFFVSLLIHTLISKGILKKYITINSFYFSDNIIAHKGNICLFPLDCAGFIVF